MRILAHLVSTIAVCAGVIIAPANAVALVRWDFEQAMFTEPPQPVLDHCVVADGGVYHLFYLRGNPAVNIGHATTTDFVEWTVLDPVLAPGSWDAKLWAPYLFRHPNGWWYMYYTGVNTPGAQRSGFAFSTELSNWYKWPAPVYTPDPTWAIWNETQFSHGRDPHVIEHNGYYYMFVTAKTNTNRGAIACARSTDLFLWEDVGPLYVHSNWHVLESVFVFKRNNKFHMFFTEETVNGTSHMSSDSLLTGWNIANRRIVDGGHAPQLTDTHLGEMFSRHAVYNDQHGTLQYILRFTPLLWFGDIPGVPRPLPLQDTWGLNGEAFFYQPTWGNNAFVRNENYATTHVGDGWINTYEYYTGPLGYGAPGAALGDGKTGVMRSEVFTIEGLSMNLLVGGGDFPTECYVALVDDSTGQALYRETGRNTNEMDRRTWDLAPYRGRTAYIEVADLSTAPFGHICVDDIIESEDGAVPDTTGSTGNTGNGDGSGVGRTDRRLHASGEESLATRAGTVDHARLLPCTPNPFNPATVIRYDLPVEARVRLDVFDARGARVAVLVDGMRGAGSHAETWSATSRTGQGLASGVYFYRLAVDGVVIDTRKMVLLK